MAKKIEKALVFKLPKIIKPYVTNNQTMCSFTVCLINKINCFFSVNLVFYGGKNERV